MKIIKTYKIFINGEFPRTESGRYNQLKNRNGKLIANICNSSRKDFRNSVVAARTAFEIWNSKSAFNRSQIIYRIAEMFFGRKEQFINELFEIGISKKNANIFFSKGIDKIIYFAGWCDKYQQVFSSVNPVATNHFNFSVCEPMGVVAIISEDDSPFAFLDSMLAAIAGGNCCIILASELFPTTAISFAEVLQTSDLPKGVVNILTGSKKELIPHFSSHMDVNAIVINNDKFKSEIKSIASLNVKRVIDTTELNELQLISSLQEIKTIWHPVGV